MRSRSSLDDDVTDALIAKTSLYTQSSLNARKDRHENGLIDVADGSLMRATLLIMAALLSACASPPPQPLTDAEEVPADWTSEQLLAAQRAGFSLVTRNGEPVMCRQDAQTGSRLNQTTLCMTAKEWRRTRRTSRETLQDITSGQQPSCALEKNC